MLHFLVVGTLMGISAGFSPGPLTTLVISETLQHDFKAGFRVALAPVLSDLPIVVLVFFLLGKIDNSDSILGGLSLLGGCVLFYLAYKSVAIKKAELKEVESAPKSLKKGTIINLLSPHPYLFWLTIGAPLLVNAHDQSFLAPIYFVVSFYGMLVGGKILIAYLVGKSKTFLAGKAYRYVRQFLGVCLAVFGLVFFYDGLKLLKIVDNL